MLKAIQDHSYLSKFHTTTPEEYWAEGVQSYLDANKMVDRPNGIHNAIDGTMYVCDRDRQLDRGKRPRSGQRGRQAVALNAAALARS
jgi:hypothetical protein